VAIADVLAQGRPLPAEGERSPVFAELGVVPTGDVEGVGLPAATLGGQVQAERFQSAIGRHTG